MQRMEILGVRVRISGSAHDVVVLLHEQDGTRSLPILIGPHEGVAIASAQSGVHPPRPGPYELLLSALEAAETPLERVQITELRHGTFIAELVLANGATVDSRASDGIALAVRADVEVRCADAVLAEAGLVLSSDDDGETAYAAADEDSEAQVAEFRSFLDSIDPEDFAGPATDRGRDTPEGTDPTRAEPGEGTVDNDDPDDEDRGKSGEE